MVRPQGAPDVPHVGGTPTGAPRPLPSDNLEPDNMQLSFLTSGNELLLDIKGRRWCLFTATIF